MTFFRAIVYTILAVSVLITSIGCSAAGFTMGVSKDESSAMLTPVSIDSIATKVHSGDILQIELTSGDSLRGSFCHLQNDSLFLQQSNQALFGHTVKSIALHNISTLSIAEVKHTHRIAGFLAGALIDIAVIAIINTLKQLGSAIGSAGY